MTATYDQAKDDMFGLMRDALAVVAAGIHIEWQGKPGNTPPPQDAEWVRVSIQHFPTGSRQAAFSCDASKRRWRREGTLDAQCFAPEKAGGLKRAMAIATALRDAVQTSRGTQHDVWFREPVAYEVGPDKNWFNANASARFTYDEVK